MERCKMDKRERYFWDLTGYLILRNVLTANEIAAANEAIDHSADQIYVGQHQRRSARFSSSSKVHRTTCPTRSA